MKSNLYELACAYIKIIKEIERTRDRFELQKLEEQRVEAHAGFAEALKKSGIRFKDREHAARIAFRIANEEL